MTTHDDLTNGILSVMPPAAQDLLGLSLYSGREAWIGIKPLYLMGFNPGGDPEEHAHQVTTVRENTVVRLGMSNYSGYHDAWDRAAGQHPMQRGVCHLFDRLGMDPTRVPSTNLIFVRSQSVATLGGRDALIETCWPFHAAMMERLGTRVIVAMGVKATGNPLRARLGATQEIDTYKETNKRGLTSRTWLNPTTGIQVCGLTHPSRFHWHSDHGEADPSPLVARAMARAGHA